MKDIIVIGGGIVGLATAWQIKQHAPKLTITILEKESGPARHQTGNNSGVIHSGLYYKPGSLKATNCIKGYDLMLAFCRKEEVDYDLCGKVVVATDNQEIPYLETLYERGEQNGLKNLKWLDPDQIKAHEPYVTGVKGIYVPQTGIIDYKEVCKKLESRLLEEGVVIYYNQKVEKIKAKGSSSEIITHTNTYKAKLVVNCAGLYSDKVAKMTPLKPDLKIVPFRGEYYQLKKTSKHLVKNLIYPVPDPNFPFLGVHFTRMMNGGIEAGPNAVLAFAREGYTKSDVNLPELLETLAWPGFQKVAMKYWKTGFGEMYRSFSKAAFTKALQKLIPDIRESDLETGGAGVRAQACDRSGGLLDDFHILEDDHFVNVCNAPSPAATSSLAIGEEIAERVINRF
ncbi:L-2-hydroxyglutarate oxidase [Reichenbachiella carrageenanivorans]|uniref:L-2-hydroxyglutarate oxidase n=1 Tax=Reichenbachiella carrageenanivorans TaxID=2979869 RepID=A0ABY6CYI2_9BACT|nr:L-2-hydroxyglutarate oxidase [Reichenbachiella carrageenanivorans]UXX78972.1 L-2-hydroxyglutarate oxidase [Reichenbachiella carrageenanivorans]